MTDELTQYKTDKAEWARLVAPRWVELMQESDDVKRAMWSLASPELRAAIRELVEARK